MIDLAFYLPTL